MSLTSRTIAAVVCMGLIGSLGQTAAAPTLSQATGEWIAAVIVQHPPQSLKRAISQLASTDFVTREQGQREIEQMGQPFALYLPAIRKSLTDVEAKRRLDLVCQKLHWNNIAIARTLTFSADQISAPNALRLIADKAGYRLKIDPLGEEFEKKKLYNFHFPPLMFWDAIDRVCNESGLVISLDEDGSLRVNFQDTYNPTASYSGPFRFVPAQIYSGRFLQLGGLNRRQLPTRNQENLTINLNVMSEPKTPIVGVRGCIVTKVIDQDGKELAQPVNEERTSQYYGGQTYRTFTQNMNVNFTRPSVDSTSLKLVSGRASLMILAEVKADIVVSDLLKSKGRKIRGRSAQIEMTDVIEVKGASPSFVVAVSPLTAGANDYNYVNSMAQKLEIVDSAARPFVVQVTSTNYAPDGTAILTLQLIPPDGIKMGAPATLTVSEWILRSMDVDFEFKDIPLP